jgi:hypothetical protein
MSNKKTDCLFCEVPCGMDHCPYTEKSNNIIENLENEPCEDCDSVIKNLENDKLELSEMVQFLYDRILEISTKRY